MNKITRWYVLAIFITITSTVTYIEFGDIALAVHLFLWAIAIAIVMRKEKK